mmetsp:Transcript_20187/g.34049  ORF Transcript_20187/g.34049 Transcript_20187/m.34049 type:complete len:306 (-) Transcript_20187:148-1065(-)|eukprot:CAMPEP_0114473790 /NCGR_PEP_ID=MMETSP0104-20121206/13182_1 /TAXON_ID=37642 ORGANISM="Paraphysomonas imperforata, Strain PA2" /NCGR_SAMPLE_ID=MMETSP0104 /ASSEMBLY_ACC=CAM_ASM_000202 /LENGTH=305 /DNA_ID=CAMNT_0001648023 /DNA_START=53 /DNA_END=970 /DNA_ORIENTATION=-
MPSSPSKSARLVGLAQASTSSSQQNARQVESAVEDTHFEDTFRGYLGSLKHTVLSCTHPNFKDDKSILRAHELVKEDIRKAMFQLSQSSASCQTPSYAQRVSAFSYVGSKLLGEVEEMQNCASLSDQIETLKTEKDKLKEFYQQREHQLNTTLAILEKRNSELSERNTELEARSAAAELKATDTQRELDIRNNIDDDTHEKYVQLHMDILTYHSRVKNKAAESLRSIKAKVGFVPREVEEHLLELQRVKAPGADMVFSASASRSPVRKKRAVQRPRQDKQQPKGGKRSTPATADTVDPSDISLVL